LKYFEGGNVKDLSDKIGKLCLNPDLGSNQTKEALKELSHISGSVMKDNKLTEKKMMWLIKIISIKSSF